MVAPPTPPRIIRITGMAPLTLNSSTRESSPALSLASVSTDGKGKKRSRSDESSDYEKEKKRKLMNRIAAQQSRDKKKAHMEELEQQVAILKAENEKLKQQNATITKEKDVLVEENLVLKTSTTTVCEMPDVGTVKCEMDSTGHYGVEDLLSFGSAALINVPQQQGQAKSRFSPVALQLILMMLHLSQTKASMSYSSGSTTSAHHARIEAVYKILQNKVRQLHPSPCKTHASQWWGSHQRSWQPSKICSSPFYPPTLRS